MKSFVTFGQCIRRILESRELSVQEGARLMQMKSATSLSRIIHDEVNIKTLEVFYQALLENTRIAILPEEKHQLENALLIQRIGLERFLTYQATWQLLLSDSSACDPDPYTIECRGSALQSHPFHTINDLIALYEQCTDMEITIIGCCRYMLLDHFYPLAARKENPVRITHFLHNRTDRPHILMGSIAAIRRFLPMTCYTAYITDPNTLTPEGLAVYDGNRIFCSFTDAWGKRRMHHLVLLEPRRLLLMEYRFPAPYLFQMEPLNYYKERLSPIQTQFPDIITAADYIQFAEFNRKKEADKSLFSIKPDIHLPFIHPDILLAAWMRSMEAETTPCCPDVQKEIRNLYRIHAERHRNFFTKKKVTHVVLSPSAMQRFVSTGRLSDHFFTLSAFTPAERRSILTHLRQQMSDNPYFNIYFSNDDSLPFYLEITRYENQGVMIANANSSYNLSEGHAESMITHPDFIQAFQDFFTQELLRYRVMPLQKGLSLMDQWIASLPAAD